MRKCCFTLKCKCVNLHKKLSWEKVDTFLCLWHISDTFFIISLLHKKMKIVTGFGMLKILSTFLL